jgi:hypothetical protein
MRAMRFECDTITHERNLMFGRRSLLIQINAALFSYVSYSKYMSWISLRGAMAGVLLVLLAIGAHAQSLHEAHERANVPCASCHMPELSDIAPQEKSCVACHGTMLEPREGKQQISPDPHRSPHLGEGEVPVCSECHKIHGKSEVTCVMCHRSFHFEAK